MFSSHLLRHAEIILAECRSRSLKLATAESCTGGLIAACFTEIAGSSDVVDRGFVTYSNEAKRDLLGVPGDLIADYGAVSEQVARTMAEGAVNNSLANISISVTGVAGPGGGTPLKPVGLVHFGCALDGASILHERHLFDDLGRSVIREKAVEAAMQLLRNQLGL